MAKGENILSVRMVDGKHGISKGMNCPGKSNTDSVMGKPIRKQKKKSPRRKLRCSVESRYQHQIPGIVFRGSVTSGLNLGETASKSPPV